jgi:hypothetical protein
MALAMAEIAIITETNYSVRLLRLPRISAWRSMASSMSLSMSAG